MNKQQISLPTKIKQLNKIKTRYIVLYGGRGGAKSWGVSIYLIIRALKSKILILCTREVQNTIKDSVHKLLSDSIERMSLEKLFVIKRDEIVCRNGSKFIFKGLRHNSGEIKSTEGIDICWIEEAHNITQESLDFLIPTVRKESSQIIFTFNPQDMDAPVYRNYVLKDRDELTKIKINYNDNPFFPDVLRKEMEYDKQNDYDKYLHVWEGEPKTITDACIFKGKFVVDYFDTHEKVDYYYGADWGFSNDPTCIIRCYIHDNNLYIDQEAYGVGIEIDEIPQLFDSVPGARINKIRADNSRPDTISYLNRIGWIIRPARKGQNSVQDGIEFIKKFKKIYIHERCKNTAYEFKSYSYKKDRLTEEILPIIVDKDNHCIDSLRYALEDLRKGLNDKLNVSSYKLENILFK